MSHYPEPCRAKGSTKRQHQHEPQREPFQMDDGARTAKSEAVVSTQPPAAATAQSMGSPACQTDTIRIIREQTGMNEIILDLAERVAIAAYEKEVGAVSAAEANRLRNNLLARVDLSERVSIFTDFRGRHRPGATAPVAGVRRFLTVGRQLRHAGTPRRSIPPARRFPRLRRLKMRKA